MDCDFVLTGSIEFQDRTWPSHLARFLIVGSAGSLRNVSCCVSPRGALQNVDPHLGRLAKCQVLIAKGWLFRLDFCPVILRDTPSR
jgi:hypothetical protein